MSWKGLPARKNMLRGEHFTLVRSDGERYKGSEFPGETRTLNGVKLEAPERGVANKRKFLRVVEYNLHAETYGWGPDRFEPCDPTVELEKLHSDVYVLPELWAPDSSEYPESHIFKWAKRTGREVHTARSAKATPRQVKGHSGDAHIAVVTHLPVLQVETFRLPKHRRDKSAERDVIAVLIQAPWGAPVWILGVHMSATVPHVPIHNLLNLAHFLTELEQTGHPVIISGDFNLWGWWVRAIHRKRYRRAVRGRTWPSYRPHSQIDHILTRKTLKVVESGVLPVGFSDHRAIYATITQTPNQ